MEIELEKIDGGVRTFFNVDWVEDSPKGCKISSGGQVVTVRKSYETVKRMIMESNMREASLVMNI